MPERRLVVVSNRLPDAPRSDAHERRSAQVGGLVSALLPAIQGCERTAWFGWDGRHGSGRRTTVATRRGGAFTTHALGLPGEVVDDYYTGFCNGGLWPLLHSFPGRFTVTREQYEAYRRVNGLFAREIAKRLERNDRIWVHDFHLIPLASELRARGFRGPIGFFLHVPFPQTGIWSVLPWGSDLLEQLASYDVVGFHTAEYARNFRRALGSDRLRPRTPLIGVYPIGIDPAPYEEWSQEPSSITRGKEVRDAIRGRKLVLGVDRLDYTKGILERLAIFGRFLELYPRWHGKVSFIQISAPSRTKVAAYALQRREVEELVGNLNGRHGEPDWVPVRYLFKAYDQRALAAFYREADVGLVTPLRDGMNLVAKEYVAAQTGDPGVLVLSKFAGAAAELAEAVQVNPYDVDASAHSLAQALAMPLPERLRRQRALLGKVRSQTATAWCRSFLADLDAAATAAERPPRAHRSLRAAGPLLDLEEPPRGA